MQFHRTTASAATPIGQASTENAAPSQAETLARRLLMQMFGNDAALIDGWKRTFDVRWLAPLGFAAIHATSDRCQELIAAYERIAKLEADLLECREYIEQEVDVVDGDHGEPAPNRAMSLCSMIDETLNGSF